MLLEHLVDDPAWLSRRLDFARPEDFAEESAVTLLYVVRRYAAKLLYELELHGDVELEPMRGRYVELLHDATKIEPSPADYLADVDEGFYATCYLRAWAFHTQLETHLREEFGRAWFTRREAGSLLREVWAEGQRLTAAELLDEVAGASWSWPPWVSESRRRWLREESRHRRRGRPRLPQLQRRLPRP